MRSALYEGVVTHVRKRPRRHRMAIRLMMPLLDLDELPTLFDGDARFGFERTSIAAFRRADHVGPASRPLADVVRDIVDERLGRRPSGPVSLLTHLRYAGIGFNPVSFYYCHDERGDLDAIVSEVNNTPWGERHCYVHDARRTERGDVVDRFEKVFHVSPFMPLDQRYVWRFSPPGQALAVDMASEDEQGTLFHASMRLERRPFDRAARTRLLVRYPLLTAHVLAAIYGHALALRLRGTPYVPHPDHPRRRSAPRESPWFTDHRGALT